MRVPEAQVNRFVALERERRRLRAAEEDEQRRRRAAEEAERQRRRAAEEAELKARRERRDARRRGHPVVRQAAAERYKRFVQEIASVPEGRRSEWLLEHTEYPLGMFPPDWAEIPDEVLDRLGRDGLRKLAERIGRRERKGVWTRLWDRVRQRDPGVVEEGRG